MNGKGDVTVQELAASLIRVFEGLKLDSYQDAGKVWTIGYGHTGTLDGLPLAAGMTVTEKQAEDLLVQDSAALFKAVDGRPLIEAAALVSFGYNCGLGALQKVLAGQSHPEDFIRAKGKVLPGLVSRRKLESLLMTVRT